jgi:hypothetical protein
MIRLPLFSGLAATFAAAAKAAPDEMPAVFAGNHAACQKKIRKYWSIIAYNSMVDLW